MRNVTEGSSQVKHRGFNLNLNRNLNPNPNVGDEIKITIKITIRNPAAALAQLQN